MSFKSDSVTDADGLVTTMLDTSPGVTSGMTSKVAEKDKSLPDSMTTSSMRGIPAGVKVSCVMASE